MFNSQRGKKSRLTQNKTFLSIFLCVGICIFVSLYANDGLNITLNTDGEMFEVHFINIGQGDSILIRNPQNDFMLIDTGEIDQHNVLKSYLESCGVDKLKYAIFTHPHSDHIGSADKIVSAYDIETLIMPRITHTTKTFERLISAIEEKNMKITPSEVGDEYIFGDARFLIVAPMRDDYTNLNNHSVVIKMIYGKNTFLFTGDMEKESENDVIEFIQDNNADLSADVLKVAHHGSSTSSSRKFLETVNPKVAVIMCGIDNSYNHPHKETVEELDKIGASIVQTNIYGNIVISSDGNTLTINVESGEDIAA